MFKKKIDEKLMEVFLRDLQSTTIIREDKQVVLPFLHSERNTDYVKTYIEYVYAYQRLFNAHCKRLYAPTKRELKLLWERYIDFLYKNI